MSRTGSLRLNALAVLTLVLCLGGCAPQAPRLGAERAVSVSALPLHGVAGDPRYTPVRPEALGWLYDDFRAVLSRQGLVKWDASFDCNHFASLYISLAQATYAAQRWHSSEPPSALALAEVWYRPDGSVNGHAIVAALTTDGLVFIEPQTGKTLKLTDAERRSIFFVQW